MKIQCICGSKFAFDVTPDMAGRMLQFVCPSCGHDSSAFVNQLIRQELAGVQVAPPGQAIQVPTPGAAPAPATAPAPAPAPRISVMGSMPTSAPAAPAPAPAPAPTPTPAPAGAPVIRISGPPPTAHPAPVPAAASAPVPASTPISIPKISVPSVAPAPVASAAPVPAPVAAPAPVPVAAPRPAVVPPPAPRPAPAPASLVPTVPVASAPGLSISGKSHAPAAEAPAGGVAAAVQESVRCSKHPNMESTAKCHVCSKPICPKCMELFGYVCSPLCKNKAEASGIRVPKFAGQKSSVEAKLWRKVGRITYVAVGAIALWLGAWFWYAWFGSVPSPAYTVHFEEPSFSGQSAMMGKDQLIFLHGGDLARHDIKQKKQIWARNLVDMNKVKEDAAREIKEMEEEVRNYPGSARDNPMRIPPLETMIKRVQRRAESNMELKVQGDNIWIISPEKMVRYNKDTGAPDKEIALKESYSKLIPRGEEMMQMYTDQIGNQSLTYVNLNTCETRSEDVYKVATFSTNGAGRLLASAGKGGTKRGGKAGADTGGGLPMKPGSKDAGKPMDPKKVSEQAAHLSLPERIALPAIIANTRNQDRALAEAKDPSDPTGARKGKGDSDENYRVMLTKDGYVKMQVKLLEERHTERVAVKPPPAPGKSVLDGNLTASKSMELASEMLNEMQRESGGAIEREDLSRYEVSFKRAGETTPFKCEVIGPPSLHSLATVDVLTSNKKIEVFDKTHKKLWDATLTFNVGSSYGGDLDDEEGGEPSHGEGPCVEHKGILYVYDQGVLTAFDLSNGNARWRLPSVGITGLFFDDQENIYLNTTSASPETLKYTKEINISDRKVPIVIKVDSKTGHALWAAQPGGPVSYVSGKFVYSLEAYKPFEDDEHPFEVNTGFETRPFIRIKRLNVKNGHQMWEYSKQRSPYDIDFDKNMIRIVFKNDVVVLKYITL